MNNFRIIRKVLSYINLESELDDYDTIHKSITKEITFKGTNLWILVFAIIVASVGLNMNSTAVIIGAMLISPLMGPINGIGYSIATYNFPLFKTALKNFLFAVGASLIASTTYFLISPISTAHSELLARTSPTIYDVIIALFGGLAGIVAISSKLKGNVIPGVAIATALMPPLCTAGYGLATGQYFYFFGAFYLFTINTVFIAISSVVISQILKFPILTIVDKGQKKRVNSYISVVISLVLIPSVYFGYNLVQKERFLDNAARFIESVSIVDGNYLIKNDVDFKDKIITLVYSGAALNEKQKEYISSQTGFFSLNNVKVKFFAGLNEESRIKINTEQEQLKTEITRLNALLTDKSGEIDSLKNANLKGRILLGEIQALFPDVIQISYTESSLFKDNISPPDKFPVIVITSKKKNLTSGEKVKINNWLQKRLNNERCRVFFD